jgi:predicted transcriptional regulator
VNILFGYAQSQFQGIFRKDRIYLLMLQDCGEFILKYRNKTDIVAQMLASATDREVARTRMMSIAYVPHEQATQFLAMLVESGLLMYDQETRLYRTSQKG